MKQNVLVAYGSWAGSTGEIAELMAKAMREEGVAASAVPAGEVKDLSPYTAVVLGSGIRAGQMHNKVKAFMRRHKKVLQGMPVAYFIVCLCLQEPTPEKLDEAQGYMNVLLEKHPEVKPVSQGMFAGVLDYSKINKFLGKMMEKIENDGGEGGDYRDREAICTWARETAAKLN